MAPDQVPSPNAPVPADVGKFGTNVKGNFRQSSMEWFRRLRRRPNRLSTLSILCAITCINAIGTYLFSSGFLLTRKELDQRNTCELMRKYGEDPDAEVEYCWVKHRPPKVVLVVIDAFRFDFLVGEANNSREALFKGRMPKTQALLEKSRSCKLFKFLADAPTTTMQRLKALTTGGLPTFIDFSQSFGAPAIQEDNIIQQLQSNNRRTWFVGDDTWQDLFPNTMVKAMPYPSLNVKDLHTVDDGVESFFPDAIEAINEWDVLIGHFLGVDHAGHIFSVDDEEMAKKLDQMDNFMNRTITKLEEKMLKMRKSDPDVLFLLIGDHGQTLRGEHGGASKEEVETVMLAYKIGREKDLHTEYNRLHVCDDCQGHSNKHCGQCIPELQQIDFAATLSFILDIPIPFGNVGSISPLMFDLLSNRSHDLPASLMANAGQVQSALDAYNYYTPFSYDHAMRIRGAYSAILQTSEEGKMKSLATYFKIAVGIARAEWNEFNEYKMACGLLTLLISLFFHGAWLLGALCKFGCSDGKKRKHVYYFEAIAILISTVKALAPYSKRFLEIEAQATAFLFATSQLIVRRELFANTSSLSLLFLALFSIPLSVYNPLAFKGQIDEASCQSKVCSILLKVFAWDEWTDKFQILCDIFAMISMVLLWRFLVKPQVAWGLKDVFMFLPATLLATYRLGTVSLHLSSSVWIGVILPRCLYAIMIVHSVSSLAQIKQTSFSTLFLTVAPVMCLLHGRHGEIALLSLCLEGLLTHIILQNFMKKQSNSCIAVLILSCLWYMFFWHSYFATGHGCNFQSLNFIEAYIGFEDFDFIVQGTLLAFSTFSIPFWCSFLLPVSINYSIHSTNDTKRAQSWYEISLAMCSALQTLTLFVASSSAGYQRRHLMAWGLFAPKFVFDSLLVHLSQIGITLGALYLKICSNQDAGTVKKAC